MTTSRRERSTGRRLRERIRAARALCTALLLLALSSPCYALTSHGMLSNVEYTVYAPDWTWQDREVNILVVLAGTDNKPAKVNVALAFPPGKSDDFAYKGKTEINTTLTGSSRVRDAFVGIKPLSRAPRQIYPFQIRINVGNDAATVDYPLRTIRGAAVNPGRWAVLLPAGVAAAWCLVLLIALRKMAAHGAWRKPSEPALEPEAPDEWITRNPT